MSASTYAELKYHINHRIEVVGYGYGAGGVRDYINVAAECTDCCVTLLDFDRPPRPVKVAAKTPSGSRGRADRPSRRLARPGGSRRGRV